MSALSSLKTQTHLMSATKMNFSQQRKHRNAMGVKTAQ